MELIPQIVLLTGKEALRKKPGKLALREGEMYYEKKPGQVCIIFFNFFFLFSVGEVYTVKDSKITNYALLPC